MRRTHSCAKHHEQSDSCVAFAVALQDHFSRTLQLGGPKRLPSQLPGAPLTLAQRAGIIPKPDKLLTEEEWGQIHGRSRQRKDPFTACAICLETFKAEQQVLLSCSHVFHTQCLASFEAHVRVKACPLCRKQWYQKHTISDAAEAFRHVCAARIQAAVRGWLCRKTLALGLQNPPEAPSLRHAWISARLEETRQALAGMVQGAADDLDELFAELDANVAASRQLGDPDETRLLAAAAAEAAANGQGSTAASFAVAHSQQGQQQRQGRSVTEITHRRQYVSTRQAQANNKRTVSSSRASQSYGALDSTRSAGDDSSNSSSSSGRGTELRRHAPISASAAAGAAAPARSELQRQQQHPSNTASSGTSSVAPSSTGNTAVPAVDWEQVVGKVCERGETECAICLAPLAAQREAQGVCLLSCSHIFHAACVASFERFEQGRGGQASCPVCRSLYSRRCFDVQDAPG